MVQPNAACAAFTNWMLTISEQKLSGPQRVLTQAIYDAAIGNTPVSDQDWYNFNLFAAWRNPFYLVYRDYAQFTAPSLLTNLIASYNLDGNSNANFGGMNGTDTGVLYNAAYGKIGQGASYAGATTFTDFAGIAPGTTYTLGFWINPQPFGGGVEDIMGRSGSNLGVRFDKGAGILYLFNGSVLTLATGIPISAWTCVVISSDGLAIKTYINGNLVSSFMPVGNALLIQRVGGAPSNNGGYFYLDMLNIWDRGLSADEADMFWNGGAGIQYPF